MHDTLIRVFYRSIAVLGALTSAACFKCDDCEGNLAPVNCRVAPALSPIAATMTVGSSIVLQTSIDAGCSAPIVRTSDPSILRLDVTMPTILVTGLRNGTTRVTLLAAADTTLQTNGVYAVGIPLPPGR